MIGTGRVVAALLAAGAVLAGSGCGATDRTAVSVDGRAVSGDDFEALGRAYLARPEAAGGDGTAAAPDGGLSGPAARDLLGQVILGHLLESFLADRDATPTPEELAAAPLEPWQADLPAAVREPLQLYALGNEALAPAIEDEAAALYDAPASESGVLCPRLIVLETEEEAADVISELEGGADFAELATERSIDPGSAANGGVAANQTGAECLGTASMSPDSPVAAAALPLSPGTWSAPVSAPIDQDGTLGWFVVTARPYDEVAAEVSQIVGGQVVGEYLRGVEVDVDPMYGRWDPDQFAVVSL